jgi:hypothetical protein
MHKKKKKKKKKRKEKKKKKKKKNEEKKVSFFRFDVIFKIIVEFKITLLNFDHFNFCYIYLTFKFHKMIFEKYFSYFQVFSTTKKKKKTTKKSLIDQNSINHISNLTVILKVT